MNVIRSRGRTLQAALPQETVMANLVRRILKVIREEFDILQTKAGDKRKIILPWWRAVILSNRFVYGWS